MTGQAFDHVGLVVPDLAAARARFTAALGLEFTEVVTFEVRGWEHVDHGSFSEDLHVCYSVEGPPHLELIEQTEHGIWAGTEVGHIHHLGYAVPDVEARMREVQQLGIRAEMRHRQPETVGELVTAFTVPSDLHGVRLEFLKSGRALFMDLYGPASLERRRRSTRSERIVE